MRLRPQIFSNRVIREHFSALSTIELLHAQMQFNANAIWPIQITCTSADKSAACDGEILRGDFKCGERRQIARNWAHFPRARRT